VRGQRIGHRARHRTERGLVQHDLRTAAGLRASGGIGDVALHKTMACPRRFADTGAHVIEIALVAGGEVVEAGHLLAAAQQMFEQVRADEAGAAGDEPATRHRTKPLVQCHRQAVFADRRCAIHDQSRHTCTPRSVSAF
jgi:hypothetical protein